MSRGIYYCPLYLNYRLIQYDSENSVVIKLFIYFKSKASLCRSKREKASMIGGSGIIKEIYRSSKKEQSSKETKKEMLSNEPQ